MAIEFVDAPTTPLPYCLVRWHMKDGAINIQFVDSREARASTFISDLKHEVRRALAENPSIAYAELLERNVGSDGNLVESEFAVETR